MNDNSNNTSKSGKRMTRRQFIATGLAVTAGVMLTACGIRTGADNAPSESSPDGTVKPDAAVPQLSALEPTPACGDIGATPEVTEGPYFTPNSPERSSLLEQGMKGVKLTITGYVLSTDCKPVAKALLDFWQANTNGEYDNKGYTLRGHLYTDEKGKFTLATIVPGIYPGRTRHIHVKAQAPGKSILTTQLFFPNESGNANDGIYKESLLMKISDNTDGSKSGSFNFVLNV